MTDWYTVSGNLSAHSHINANPDRFTVDQKDEMSLLAFRSSFLFSCTTVMATWIGSFAVEEIKKIVDTLSTN